MNEKQKHNKTNKNDNNKMLLINNAITNNMKGPAVLYSMAIKKVKTSHFDISHCVVYAAIVGKIRFSRNILLLVL